MMNNNNAINLIYFIFFIYLKNGYDIVQHLRRNRTLELYIKRDSSWRIERTEHFAGEVFKNWFR